MIDNTNNSIGEKNPYRYRSYYYNTETTWYYLNSRYYNPNIGRFITKDEIEYLGATSSTVALTTASTAIGIVSEVVEKATTTVITGVLSALPILVTKECVTLDESVNLCPYSYGGISTGTDNISSFPKKQSNPPSEFFCMARTGIMLKNEFLCYMC